MAWTRDRTGSRRRRNSDSWPDEFESPAFPARPAMQPRRETAAPTADRTNVTATVKWFNPTKGFGFVAATDGTPDAFLHVSALSRAGRATISEGATLVVDLGQGQRGPQVVAIHSVDESTATATATPSARPPRHGPPMSSGGGEVVDATVKWFNPEKGFGFASPDDGGKDIFVHIRALERSGISTLQPEQRVRITTSMGEKGPQANAVELI
ncbi:MAG: cold-shock protein [Alphaproteobacteria bacterium]|nr:cold-shock protein [Alphaproteobacteria bacterium]